MKKFYVGLNITCLAVIISAWFGGHISSGVDWIATILGVLMLNGMTHLSMSYNPRASGKEKRR